MTQSSSDTTRNSRPLTRSRSTAFALSALILLGLIFPLPAYAACTTPAGEAGDQFFNTTVSRMQYCDGTNWVNMGVSALSDNLGDHTATQALAMGGFNITGAGAITGTSFTGVGTALTALNASNLGSGTVPTARLGTGTANATTYLRGDGTWVAVSGGGDDLGNHTATQALAMGGFNITGAGAITGTSFTGVGTALTALNASNLGSGTVPTARLGTGTANATTYLRGDGSWAAPTAMETDPKVGVVTNGQWCRGSGTQVVCDQNSPSGGSNVQTFNASGTWSKPFTGTMALVECWGGGGGGGRNTSLGGVGGAGGGYSQRHIPASSLPPSVSVTIGAGGAPGTNNVFGGTGGNSSFGTFLTAYGGTGGYNNSIAGSSYMPTGNISPYEGGGYNAGASQATQDGVFAGGGGGSAGAGLGGKSVYGGGGGGGNTGTGGTSLAGGNGGGASANGLQPGGGGGGGRSTPAGSGGAGMCRVSIW